MKSAKGKALADNPRRGWVALFSRAGKAQEGSVIPPQSQTGENPEPGGIVLAGGLTISGLAVTLGESDGVGLIGQVSVSVFHVPAALFPLPDGGVMPAGTMLGTVTVTVPPYGSPRSLRHATQSGLGAVAPKGSLLFARVSRMDWADVSGITLSVHGEALA